MKETGLFLRATDTTPILHADRTIKTTTAATFKEPTSFMNTLLGTSSGLIFSGMVLLASPAHAETNGLPQHSTEDAVMSEQIAHRQTVLDALSIGALATALGSFINEGAFQL